MSFKGGLVHSGIRSSALWFIKNIVPTLVHECRKRNLKKITLVGHSLVPTYTSPLTYFIYKGAATASVLAMMMEDGDDGANCLSDPSDSTLPRIELHCFAFSPPPSVSLELARAYTECIDSYVVEDDAICRLSYGHMMDVKAMIVCAVEDVKSSSKPPTSSSNTSPSFFTSVKSMVSHCTYCLCCCCCTCSHYFKVSQNLYI